MLQTKSIFLHNSNSLENIKELEPKELEQLQQHLWNMYSDLVHVCEKHNLQISLAYGNVIGILRHNGWIPWDDDLDVHMPRKDYEELLTKHAHELPSQYKFFSAYSEDGPIYRFAKLVDTSTLLVPVGGQRENHSGIYIDIFPIDNIGCNKYINRIKKYWQYFLMYTSSSVAQYQEKSQDYKRIMCATKKGKLNYLLRKNWGVVFSFLNKTKWYALCEKTWIIKKETSYIHVKNAIETCGMKIPKNTFLPPRKYSCDLGDVYIPQNPEEYLKLHYKNWREIPKDSEKWHHYVKEIKIPQK